MTGRSQTSMQPFGAAFEKLGLSGAVEVLPVQSGYPSPKQINLVLRIYKPGQRLD